MSSLSFSERHRIEQKYVESIHAGASELQAAIISSRILKESASDIIAPSAPNINPSSLKDLDKSSNRIARAIGSGEMIYLSFDFEIESVASASLLYKAITELFNHNPRRIRMLASNRIVDGFGFTTEFLERIKITSPTPTLIVSLNQSTDANTVAKDYSKFMKEQGLFGDLICVTSKRITNDTPVNNIFGMINPNNTSNLSELNSTAGITTMMLVSRIRAKLANKGISRNIGKINDLLPLSLIGSLDETNDMTDKLNRFMIKSAFRKLTNMLTDATTPPWVIALSLSSGIPLEQFNNIEVFKSSINKLIVAASLSEKNALLAAKFFIAKRAKDAERYLFLLQKDNVGVIGKTNPIAPYIENARIELETTPNTAITFSSSPVLGVMTQAVDGIINEFGCVSGLFTTYTVRQRHITPQYLEENSIDMFKELDDRVVIDLADSQQIIVSKAIKTTLPTFELVSVFGGDVKKIRDLSLDEAVKLSPKKLFKGMASKVHSLDTKFGTVCLDLTSWRKPKLYTNSINDIKGIIRSPENINVKIMLEEIQKKHPKIFSEIHGDENLQNIRMHFSKLALLKSELSSMVNKLVIDRGLTLEPTNYVDSLCGRHIDQRMLEEITELEPFGENFPEPTFQITGKIDKVFVVKDRCQYRVTCNHGESLLLLHNLEISESKMSRGDTFNAIVRIKPNVDGKFGVSLLADAIAKI
ncbi:hypothetical protein [Photobacterium damselae]|uniref:hypothetical protein n=1 Tax=Photobacterium damselae TaxID=38293 RepID=UPI001F482AD9|nr:hypothetical protein [Photobacterium damselae]UKA04648.1 hypothetical protein IHC89_23805 [Photobacterium damselae subsp. damselae]